MVVLLIVFTSITSISVCDKFKKINHAVAYTLVVSVP